METSLLHGIAAMLATANVGTWSTTTAYTHSQVGIYDGPIPDDTLEGVGLATYPVNDPVTSESTIGVQVTFRSVSKAGIRDRAESVFNTLHALWGHSLAAGPRIDHMMRRSSADLGTDEAGAFRRTDNYYVTVNNPTPNRT
jgi:hypothetical protein